MRRRHQGLIVPDGSYFIGVRWMDLEFDYFVRWFKGGGLGSFVEYHIVPIHRRAQHSQLVSR